MLLRLDAYYDIYSHIVVRREDNKAIQLGCWGRRSNLADGIDFHLVISIVYSCDF